jgi:hypothetical protein
MRTSILAIMLFMSACTNKPREVWTAIRETPIYASESDTEERVVFTVAVGDTCSPVREIVMKAYMHTEIECKSGRGWVVDKQNFVVKAGG